MLSDEPTKYYVNCVDEINHEDNVINCNFTKYLFGFSFYDPQQIRFHLPTINLVQYSLYRRYIKRYGSEKNVAYYFCNKKERRSCVQYVVFYCHSQQTYQKVLSISRTFTRNSRQKGSQCLPGGTFY